MIRTIPNRATYPRRQMYLLLTDSPKPTFWQRVREYLQRWFEER